jgi:DNA-binding NtrC family response regulator
MVARAIHAGSVGDGPLISCDCGSATADEVKHRLFGAAGE